MREFNVTGICIPEENYMVNIDAKLESIISLVERGKYFVINRPRQYGKTTTLSQIKRKLSGEYIIISTSLEGLADKTFETDNAFAKQFSNDIEKSLRFNNVDQKVIDAWKNIDYNGDPWNDISRRITELISSVNKDIILMIDEVDKASGYSAPMNMLGMLRSKYLMMRDDRDKTFKSVILAGVRDTAHLRSKIRSDQECAMNSPWNITAEFNVDMSFSPEEISTMLAEYEKDHHTGMDIDFISNEIYKFTSGYPFLVSYICKKIDEELDKSWNCEGIQKAIKIFMNSDVTLANSLTEKIENNEDLSSLIDHILIEMEPYEFVRSDEAIKKGILYGILASDEGNNTIVSNKIFETYLYRHLIAKRKRTLELYKKIPSGNRFLKDGKLDMAALMDSFSIFLRDQALNKERKFFEKENGLLFMAYLSSAINGKGYFYQQVTTGDDKRIDLVVNYANEEFIVEFKLWYGEKRHNDAYCQLAEYMRSKNADKGYLLTISYTGGKSRQEWVDYKGKKIYDVVVEANFDTEMKLKELKSLTIEAEKVQRELNEALNSVRDFSSA